VSGKNTAKSYDKIRAAALEAMKIFKEEERQRVRRTRYHNTELLLKNYLNLLDHYANAKEKGSDIFDLEELGLDADTDDVIINAIKRSRIRTSVMIAQIETSLQTLEQRQVEKGQPEKYEVIYCLFLDKARRDIQKSELVEIVGMELHCDRGTVYRWKKEMIAELSVLIFGIDGLRLDI
jgi:hypothetical protein